MECRVWWLWQVDLLIQSSTRNKMMMNTVVIHKANSNLLFQKIEQRIKPMKQEVRQMLALANSR
jgi:hypothetical protein